MQNSYFSGQRIFITGASGFIGSHLCRRLVEFENVEVHALSRVKRSSSKGMRWWKGDISDQSSISSILKAVKPNYIFHLASQIAGSRDISLVTATLQSNLMESCKVGCKRFISTGSMDEPGSNASQEKTISPYAVAKWAAGVYGEMFHALYCLPYVHLRLFMVYGPGQNDVKKLIPYSILSMLRGNPPALTSGRRRVDWIYVEDVVDGILAAALTPNIEGSKLELGSGSLVSISSLEEMLVNLIQPQVMPRYGELQDRLFEQEPVTNVSETYARINWNPKVSMDVGLEKTVKWYSENIHRFDKITIH